MTRMRVLSLILALALVLTALAACTKAVPDSTVPVAKYDGGELPLGVYLYYLSTCTADAAAATGIYDEKVLDETIDGIPAEEWITAQALDAMRAHAAIENDFAARSLSLGEEENEKIAALLESFWEQYEEDMEDTGIDKASVERVLTVGFMGDVLRNAIYGEGGEKAIPAKELETYYKQNYRRAIMLAFSVTDLEEEVAAELNTYFTSYVERAKAGEDIRDLLIEEYARQYGFTKEQAAEAFVDVTQETLVSKSASGYPDGLVNAIFNQTVLDTPAVFENDSFKVLYEVRDLMGDTDFEEIRELILAEVVREEYSDYLVGKVDSINYTFDAAACEKYTPEYIIEAA